MSILDEKLFQVLIFSFFLQYFRLFHEFLQKLIVLSLVSAAFDLIYEAGSFILEVFDDRLIFLSNFFNISIDILFDMFEPIDLILIDTDNHPEMYLIAAELLQSFL